MQRTIEFLVIVLAIIATAVAVPVSTDDWSESVPGTTIRIFPKRRIEGTKKEYKNIMDSERGLLQNLENSVTSFFDGKAIHSNQGLQPSYLKRSKVNAPVSPESCPCKQGPSNPHSVCWDFTDEKSGTCAKRPCLPSYVCIPKTQQQQHGITCMRRKTTSRIVAIGYYTCIRKRVDGFMYVPYDAY